MVHEDLPDMAGHTLYSCCHCPQDLNKKKDGKPQLAGAELVE